MTARQEYPALLGQLAPEQAVQVLNDRVALIKQVNSSVADWLQERRRVEDAYVQGLRKLSSRPQHDNEASLGVFQIPWQRIVAGTENLAASHEILSQKIESDVEGPLRRFNTSNPEIKAVASSQGNLATLARGIESAQKKAAKGGRKAEETTSSVDEASRSWDSQAPYIFEQLQALDEQRINHLRDVLTQLQTHELDQVERTRASAESCLNALLNVETGDEIRTFADSAAATAIAAAERRETLPRRRSSVAGSTRPGSSTASFQYAPAAAPPRLSQRGASDSPTASPDQQPAALDQTPHKSKLGGLKRLGTVIKGRKSTAPTASPSTEKKKKKERPFSTFRRAESSRSFQDLEVTGQDLPANSSTDEGRNRLAQVQSTVTETQEDFTPPLGTPQTEDATARDPATNGTSTASTDVLQAASPLAAASSTSHPLQTTQGQSDELAVLQPTPVHGGARQTASQEVPTATLPSLHREASYTTDSEEGARNFAIREQPIPEDEGAAHQAMNSMAQQLRIQAQSSGLSRNQGTLRGRRDVRNTVFVPSGVDSAALLAAGGAAVGGVGAAVASSSLHSQHSATEQASPIPKMAALRSLHDDGGVGSDTTSIHSAHSLATQPHHPDLHDPGLNASIIETVNTSFNESGTSKSFVTGEIALAYNTPAAAAAAAAAADTEVIRLQHFELLEKVAANPIFVSPPPKATAELASEESAGTYSVALSAIRRSTPLVGLKYQLHIDAAFLSRYSPLLITPAWQLIEGQASIIVQYALNPVFAAAATSITFRNVIISVSLDSSGGGPIAQSAVMSPQQGATFRRKSAAVIWRLPELTVQAEQQSRLLVRFITPGGTAKKGSIDVKFELPGRAGSQIGVLVRQKRQRRSKETDPFADHERISDDGGDDNEHHHDEGAAEAETWHEVSTRRSLVSGRYTAA